MGADGDEGGRGDSVMNADGDEGGRVDSEGTHHRRAQQ